MTSFRHAWSRFFDEERDAYLLGLLRVAFGALIFVHCARLALELQRHGYFADYFFMPLMPASWVPSRGAYELLLLAQAFASLCAISGWWPREALLGASGIGFFVLLCDRLQY